MSTNTTNGEESTGTDLEPRDVRALTEYTSVLGRVGRAAGADGLYLIVSESGSEYLVDARDGVCECPDYQYRENHCKHQRAIEFATGRRTIPRWVDVDAINNTLGAHIDESPAFETSADPDPAPELVESDAAEAVVTDGGVRVKSDAESDTEGEGCPFGHPECEGAESKRERPVLCFDCWDAWAAPQVVEYENMTVTTSGRPDR